MPKRKPKKRSANLEGVALLHNRDSTSSLADYQLYCASQQARGPAWLTVSSPRAQMVFYKRWEEFAGASGALYEASPVKCIKFKTRSAVFLNRFELLNRSLLAQFQHRKPSPPPPSFPAPSGPSGADKAQPDPAAAPLPPTTVPSADEQPKPKKKKSKKKK
uniref:SRP9 domain-containing protein n=1 Tax=Leucosporidium scottii TaxID=5278 RepID=A0A0H5FT82_9BASI|nr:hypothetical protein [Leucosporidium scottii]